MNGLPEKIGSDRKGVVIIERALTYWKMIATVATVLGVGLWRGFVFVYETKEAQDVIVKHTAAIDSLRLQCYILQLRVEGRLLEYNPPRYLDSIKKAEGR